MKTLTGLTQLRTKAGLPAERNLALTILANWFITQTRLDWMERYPRSPDLLDAFDTDELPPLSVANVRTLLTAAMPLPQLTTVQAAELVIEHLRHKQMLLVLGNLEQIRAVAPLVAALVAECPGLCVLATSREQLHLRAEQRCKVPPLDLEPAVDLFVQRAAALDAGFRRTPQNQATLEAICLRLDCLPLALELCAAQVDLLSLTQLLARLHTLRLDLLVDGAHDLPLHQRSLRTAIDASYALLDEADRSLLRCLGIFMGGCDW